jgi:hypothetical protein
MSNLIIEIPRHANESRESSNETFTPLLHRNDKKLDPSSLFTRRNPTPGISGAHEPAMIKDLLDARPLHAVVRRRLSEQLQLC